MTRLCPCYVAGMSLVEERSVACPSCGKPVVARVHRSVDATREPELEEQLLDGRLFRFACPACGHVTRVVDPELVYRDAKRDLVVQLDALGTVEATKTPAEAKTTRVVRDSNALIEKVKIGRAGLDDRIVEALKLVARQTLGPDAEGKRLLFEALDGEGEAARLRFVLIGAEGVSGVAFPRATYDRLAAKLGAGLPAPGPWAVVDEAFARVLFGG